MKKWTSVFALLAVAGLALTGCGTDADNSTADSVQETTTAVSDTTTGAETQTETTVAASEDITETETVTTSESAAAEETSDDSTTSETSAEESDAAEAPNEYGFYTEKNPPATSVSVAALAGTWNLADSDINGVLTITATDDIYYGNWSYAADGAPEQNGCVKLEYLLNPDDSKDYYYTFYETDGAFWEGFGVSGEAPLNDLYAGQSGVPHYTRAE
ncbi:MAG: hypothetical protein MJ071_07165 [Oscillospiraceae bacterium]|nr:hypothetical protein [Oscillospiraceae bacterium]